MNTMEHDIQDSQVVKKVKTAGVTSHVLRETEMEYDVTLGHVIMYDFENVTPEHIRDYMEDNMNVPVVFFFESSTGNYHGLCPIVVSLQEAYEIKSLNVLDDPDHDDVGIKKGQWTLRTEEKGSKPRPEYRGLIKKQDANLKADYTFSKPHLDILVDRYDVDYAFNILEECKSVGDGTYAVAYKTRENNHELDNQ